MGKAENPLICRITDKSLKGCYKMLKINNCQSQKHFFYEIDKLKSSSQIKKNKTTTISSRECSGKPPEIIT